MLFQLRHQIPEASLNLQKACPAAAPADESEQVVSNPQSMRADEVAELLFSLTSGVLTVFEL